MANLQEKFEKEIKKALRDSFGYKNEMQIPKVVKVTLNSGLGEAKDSAELLKTAISEMAKIAGQKPRINKSKKSISGFKLRAGQIVGISATIRGKRMYDFLERLINIALPRIRDFRGLEAKSFDGQGNFSLGISEHTIFPEIKFDTVKEPLKLQVNIATSAKTKEESQKLLELLGFPFRKKITTANSNIGEQNG